MTPNKDKLVGPFMNEDIDVVKAFYESYLLAVAYADDIDCNFRHSWQGVECGSLCGLLGAYAIDNGHDDLIIKEVQNELFYHCDLNMTVPFNESVEQYLEEGRNGQHHINAKRIAFVQYWVEHLDELKGGSYYD